MPSHTPRKQADAGGLSQDASLGLDGATADAGGRVPVVCESLDVLFVIDNSASMADEQSNLAANFDGFLSALRDFEGKNFAFRIGVTTTSYPVSLLITEGSGSAGALLKTPEMTHPWLDADDPDLDSKFKSLATVGTDGSWNVQPLRAAQAALTAPLIDRENAGFLRPAALLALVFITNGDDLSTEGPDASMPGNPEPVGDFIATFDALKGARNDWTAAVIAGGTAPTCDTAFGTAVYAARLQSFAAESGDNAVFSSICAGPLSTALSRALTTFRSACERFIIF
jgi:hypothetical protein